MRRQAAIAAAIVIGAAGPRSLSLRVSPDPLAGPTPSRIAPSFGPSSRSPGPVFEPAPLPNPDIAAPEGHDTASGTQLSPMLFHRRDAFRGDGFAPGSSVESSENRNVQPSPGFRLSMPLQPDPPR